MARSTVQAIDLVAGPKEGMDAMLWVIAGLLVFLWLLGFVGAFSAGTWMPVVLALAMILIIVQMVWRSRAT